MTQQVPLIGIEVIEKHVSTKTSMEVLLTALVIVTKPWKHLPSTGISNNEWIFKCSISIQWNRKNPVIKRSAL